MVHFQGSVLHPVHVPAVIRHRDAVELPDEPIQSAGQLLAGRGNAVAGDDAVRV
jgi:hypothetical protein